MGDNPRRFKDLPLKTEMCSQDVANRRTDSLRHNIIRPFGCVIKKVKLLFTSGVS